MHDCFDQSFRLGLPDHFDDVDVTGRESHAGARLRKIHNRQSDEKCRGRDDLEINERFDSHSADLFQGAPARDADDDGRENQRRDDRLDQVNEDVAEKINFVAPAGLQPSDQRADNQADHDLGRQRWAIPWAASVGSCAHLMVLCNLWITTLATPDVPNSS